MSLTRQVITGVKSVRVKTLVCSGAVFFASIAGIRWYSASVMAEGKDSWKQASSIYDFKVNDIDGNEVTLDKYKDRVCLIVNVASKWGFTDKNYKQLQALHDELAEKGLSILAFPCNQFGSQEPGTNEEIKKFATEKYGVKFDMFAKLDVNGDSADPLWKYLQKKQKGTLGDKIKWNFSKFLVNKAGQPINRYAPNTEPFSIRKDIEKLLWSGPHGDMNCTYDLKCSL